VDYTEDDGGNRYLGEGHSVDAFVTHCCLGIVRLLSLSGIRECDKQDCEVDCGSDVLRCHFVFVLDPRRLEKDLYRIHDFRSPDVDFLLDFGLQDLGLGWLVIHSGILEGI
jgi:hypothetical protein